MAATQLGTLRSICSVFSSPLGQSQFRYASLSLSSHYHRVFQYLPLENSFQDFAHFSDASGALFVGRCEEPEIFLGLHH